jgi:CHASE2 domain-containing sensor protein
MAMKVEHEVHGRRKNRNYGVLMLLLGFIAIVFGLTVVKVLQLGDLREFETFDHVARPQIVPQDATE